MMKGEEVHMPSHFVVTAVGENRTGIVADVSEMIFESGCNIEDSQMTLLGDQFALLTLVSCKEDGDEGVLSQGCRRLNGAKGLTTSVFPVEARRQGFPRSAPPSNFQIRVEGVARSGIMERVGPLDR